MRRRLDGRTMLNHCSPTFLSTDEAELRKQVLEAMSKPSLSYSRLVAPPK